MAELDMGQLQRPRWWLLRREQRRAGAPWVRTSGLRHDRRGGVGRDDVAQCRGTLSWIENYEGYLQSDGARCSFR
jgi:hypothetical protein